MRGTPTKPGPHQEQMEAEEEVGDQEEAPSQGNTPTVATGALSHGAKGLGEILNPLPLDDTTDDRADDDGSHAIDRQEEVPVNKATGKPLTTGNTGNDEVDRSEGTEGENSVDC